MKKLIFPLLAVGLIDTLYLLYINFNQQICLVNACLSEYNLLFSILGLAWFASGFFVILFDKKSIKVAWAILGFAGIAFFVSLMVVESYFCPYCSLAHVVGGAAAIISLRT
ncbi:conserved hypothetical protein [Ferroglobus placidus DSM 10642]|uniref:Vitamin K epoxide reductase n=1 Tax=Ferroglobus placidus (strain DSM 10642 / AEDII12DO) TaxID=589924 RepID=D3RWL4_FERPA|nr:hypothetical protein [Ferroglobus placidus]ADC64877.1 conserved hypothetical protein [Ferroglobus placidus DSM 10642]